MSVLKSKSLPGGLRATQYIVFLICKSVDTIENVFRVLLRLLYSDRADEIENVFRLDE